MGRQRKINRCHSKKNGKIKKKEHFRGHKYFMTARHRCRVIFISVLFFNFVFFSWRQRWPSRRVTKQVDLDPNGFLSRPKTNEHRFAFGGKKIFCVGPCWERRGSRAERALPDGRVNQSRSSLCVLNVGRADLFLQRPLRWTRPITFEFARPPCKTRRHSFNVL